MRYPNQFFMATTRYTTFENHVNTPAFVDEPSWVTASLKVPSGIIHTS